MKGKNAKEKGKNTIDLPAGRYKVRDIGKNPIVPKGLPEKEEPGKKSSALKRFTLGSLLMILFMLLYIPSLLNWLSGKQIARDVIRNGIIEEYIQSNAVIVRNEVLLEPSAIDGRCIVEIEEGERTPAFSQIAMIMNDTSDKLIQDIEELNAKIVKARMERAEKADFFSEDLARLDEEIGLKVQKLILASNSRSFKDIGKYRTEIGKIVEKKAEIVGESSSDSYIKSLQQQKEAIQNKINRNTVQVRTDSSGIVSYRIDGYEMSLTPKMLDKLTSEKLDSILEHESQASEPVGIAKTGSPVAKIIKGTEIYIAAAVPAILAHEFKVKDKINLRINDIGLETTGTITHKNQSNEKDVIIVKINRGADFLSSIRVVNVDFISKTEEGLKVPAKSLRNVSADGKQASIMLVKFNVAANRTVDIICRDEEYAIISTPKDEYKKTVNLYDTYIINPDHVEEGDIIEK